jgi:acyl-coenzyme A synthetase/AMP-(fatty) acid ligase
MLFVAIPHRAERSAVLIGHDAERSYAVSLAQLRTVVGELFDRFEARGIEPGTTALLVTAPGNHELFASVAFLAMACFGVRVLLPMYTETAELARWLEQADASIVLVAASEFPEHRSAPEGRKLFAALREAGTRRALKVFDLHDDFGLRALLGRGDTEQTPRTPAVERALARVGADTEALIVTTSGSSGTSKLVAYTHGAFVRQCACWQAAGLYAADRLGGRGFTPLFAHTIGVRSLVNGLWTGEPTCLIDTETFARDPVRVVELLTWMSPNHLTGGPALFRLLLGMLAAGPEAVRALEGLRTIVSIGAAFDGTIAAEIEDAIGVRPHNAFGTTETQMVLTTLLGGDDEERERPLGAPLPGVEVLLEPAGTEPDLYHLKLSTVFGMARVLGGGEAEDDDRPIATGDLVRLRPDGVLRFAGRVGADLLKDGFGVKVPLEPLRARYAPAWTATDHVELVSLRGAPGLGALLFVGRADLPRGPIADPVVLADI